MITQYNPKSWFWFIAGETSRAYSSAARDYVDANEVPAAFLASTIASEIELYDVLVRAKCKTYAPNRTFTANEVYHALRLIDEGQVAARFGTPLPDVIAGSAQEIALLVEIADEIDFNIPPLTQSA